MSCGRDLRWFELTPLFSWLLLRGRCRTCSARITPRYFLVELSTGLLFAATLLVTTDIIAMLLLWYCLAVLVVITVYDLYHFIIPDRLTVYLTSASALLLGYAFYLSELDLNQVIVTVGAALAGSAFFYLLWRISEGRWLGFGDVKLAFPLGLLVGPGSVFSFVVLSFWVGAVISLTLLMFNHFNGGKHRLQIDQKALTMKSAVPFAPFLVASCLIIIFTDFNVLQLFSII
jgi:prepilin signal peptidase PulO-like enzyme (type II secretory pathway)